MAAPQAATVPVLTASAHSLEPLILDHKKEGKEAQRGALRLSLDVHATAAWEAQKVHTRPGGPRSGRKRLVCVALIFSSRRPASIASTSVEAGSVDSWVTCRSQPLSEAAIVSPSPFGVVVSQQTRFMLQRFGVQPHSVLSPIP